MDLGILVLGERLVVQVVQVAVLVIIVQEVVQKLKQGSLEILALMDLVMPVALQAVDLPLIEEAAVEAAQVVLAGMFQIQPPLLVV